jgi:hypothetical protein
MVGVVPELGRRELFERCLDSAHVLARREAGTVRDSENMRVDGNRRLPECCVEHHVRGLAADARQALERFAIGRHLATVAIQQDAAGGDDVLGLGAKEADRLDVVGDTCFTKLEHRLGRARDRKHFARRLVDRDVCRLRRQHDRDQQLKWCRVFEFSGRVRVEALQRLVDCAAFDGVHALVQRSSMGGAASGVRISDWPLRPERTGEPAPSASARSDCCGCSPCVV